jgi:hypothetical protein
MRYIKIINFYFNIFSNKKLIKKQLQLHYQALIN